MNKALLSIHVLVVIIAIGPVAVAASMFPAVARREETAVLPTLHRICRVYGAVGIAVPVFGVATASTMHVMGDAWVIASLILTTVAAGVLLVLVLPGQDAVMSGAAGRQLAMYTGIFNVMWVAVTILMIVRPGSTTGA
ncbi:MAG TPA: hypothetical protein VJ870_02985 [Amycolatopsis sp.]|nr:hypothetical protein [Amycolatopsis sp.]